MATALHTVPRPGGSGRRPLPGRQLDRPQVRDDGSEMLPIGRECALQPASRPDGGYLPVTRQHAVPRKEPQGSWARTSDEIRSDHGVPIAGLGGPLLVAGVTNLAHLPGPRTMGCDMSNGYANELQGTEK